MNVWESVLTIFLWSCRFVLLAARVDVLVLQAEKAQKSSRPIKCMILLTVLIIILVIILILRSK